MNAEQPTVKTTSYLLELNILLSYGGIVALPVTIATKYLLIRTKKTVFLGCWLEGRGIG